MAEIDILHRHLFREPNEADSETIGFRLRTSEIMAVVHAREGIQAPIDDRAIVNTKRALEYYTLTKERLAKKLTTGPGVWFHFSSLTRSDQGGGRESLQAPAITIRGHATPTPAAAHGRNYDGHEHVADDESHVASLASERVNLPPSFASHVCHHHHQRRVEVPPRHHAVTTHKTRLHANPGLLDTNDADETNTGDNDADNDDTRPATTMVTNAQLATSWASAQCIKIIHASHCERLIPHLTLQASQVPASTLYRPTATSPSQPKTRTDAMTRKTHHGTNLPLRPPNVAPTCQPTSCKSRCAANTALRTPPPPTRSNAIPTRRSEPRQRATQEPPARPPRAAIRFPRTLWHYRLFRAVFIFIVGWYFFANSLPRRPSAVGMGTQAQSVPVVRTLSAGFVVENLASNLVLPMQRTLVQDYSLPLPEHRLGHVSPFPVLSGAVECMSAQWEAAMSRTNKSLSVLRRPFIDDDEQTDGHLVSLNDLLAAIDNEGDRIDVLIHSLPSKLWERRLGMYTPSIILACHGRQTPWKSHELTITTYFHGYVSAAPTIAAWVRQGGSFRCVRPALVTVTSLVLFDTGPVLRHSEQRVKRCRQCEYPFWVDQGRKRSRADNLKESDCEDSLPLTKTGRQTWQS
ncbi:hypothetical protein EDB83DRAFT_2322284 [Lactarius deliciosus]|nr:hypothetical protein EDB83DRAFT_2322284 [Lactarius deliciosus]